MSDRSSSSRQSGRPSGRSQASQVRGLGRGSRNTAGTQPRQASSKFTGNCTELQGQIFDCSDYKQADTFVYTHKRISEYVGAEYRNGGDISSSLLNETKFEISVPPTPEVVNPEALTPQEHTEKLIFKGLIDSYIKRVSTLDGNTQKAYHLIIGQCTNLLQSKLKQQAQWSDISQSQDGIALITLIKTITFKFEDQKFLPLALYQSKANLYALRQSNMTNNKYLQRFQNLVDVASAYNGQLYDQSILNIIIKKRHTGLAYEAPTDEQKLDVNSSVSELYQATMFLHQSDCRQYGKLLEELENDFTKGNDDYPQTLVKAYHLLCEYKNYQPKFVPSDSSSSVAFLQKTKYMSRTSEKVKDDSWILKATCHECGKIGHIRPQCPLILEGDDTKVEGPSKSKSKEKKPAKKKSKKTTFAQTETTETDNEDESGNQFASYGSTNLCLNSFSLATLDLRNMILLDNQSMVDLFYNSTLVSRVWETDDTMTLHGNGGDLTTNKKAHIKNYGDAWFHSDAITNILSLKNVKSKFQVTYDSEGEGAFIIHKPDGVDVQFTAHADGLHYHDTNHHQLTMVLTVAQESEGFSKKQIAQAKTARDFQTKVGHPSTQDLKSVIKLNLIANSPVTTEDVDRAETIFGPSLPILKDKTTHQSPQSVQTDYVAVPESILSANQYVTLFGDIFFINKVPFFATVSDHLKFTTMEHSHCQSQTQATCPGIPSCGSNLRCP
jgi:hypothetical protein